MEKDKKYNKCANCVYGSDEVFKSDCEKCKNADGFLSYDEFNKDMDFWYGEPQKPKEEKAKYFLIRWLIRLIIKHNLEDCSIWFTGIVHHPAGESVKQYEDMQPFWLNLIFPFVYVWQYCDGGYSGDDFRGCLYYRLLPFVWLRFECIC